jgi:hypothetical protein
LGKSGGGNPEQEEDKKWGKQRFCAHTSSLKSDKIESVRSNYCMVIMWQPEFEHFKTTDHLINCNLRKTPAFFRRA